ncbi:hypothetical protein AB0N09_38505 [Streptomyces erythrochromogenes]|uniref:fibronectin type III domain-containing protein n=1 Tax=Streptomyces erythrochromogenes TaxID=285574 RepID=UPI003448FC12
MTTRAQLTALATTAAVFAAAGGVLATAPAAVAANADATATGPATSAAKPKADDGRWTNPVKDAARPSQPAGVWVRYDHGLNTATVYWKASNETNLAGYRVYRRLDQTGWSLVSGSSLIATPYFVDTPSPTGKPVSYQVRAVSKAGRESEGSLVVSATPVDRTGPAAPVGLTVTNDFFTSYLRWRAGDDAVRYEVYAAARETGPYTLLGAPTAPWYNDYNPPRDALRYYRVRAFDASGNPSAYSAVISGDGVDRTPPPAPTSLSSYVESTQTHIYWKMSDSFDNDRVNGGHFRIYRSPGPTLDPANLTRVTCTDMGNHGLGPCTDESMTPGAVHTYAVSAVDMVGNESPRSAPLTVRSGDRVAPGPVSGLKATPRGDGMLLSWAAPAEDDIASYVGMRGIREADGTIRWVDSDCTDKDSDPLTMLCASTPEGGTYVYAVIAKDRWGNSLSYSDQRVATVTATELDLRPAATLPTTGQDLIGMSWNTKVSGTDVPSMHWWCWKAATCAEIAGYRISRWNPATSAYQPLHTGLLPNTTESYADQSAAPGSAYFYTFEALRADGSALATHSWVCNRPLFV